MRDQIFSLATRFTTAFVPRLHHSRTLKIERTIWEWSAFERTDWSHTFLFILFCSANLSTNNFLSLPPKRPFIVLHAYAHIYSSIRRDTNLPTCCYACLEGDADPLHPSMVPSEISISWFICPRTMFACCSFVALARSSNRVRSIIALNFEISLRRLSIGLSHCSSIGGTFRS